MAFKIRKPEGNEDLRQRQPRVKDEKHLSFIRQLPCVSCLEPNMTEAAHVRYGDSRYGKRATGMSEKPDDRWTVPLCGHCHRTGSNAQHTANERFWWSEQGIDPLSVAMALYDVSGDVEAGTNIVINWHNI